jgi:CHAT domain-containing protein
VATALEAAIPPDFAYRSNIGDEGKTIATALWLADVSYSYGNAAVASARLSTAADRAIKIGDKELYLNVIHARYRGERHAGRSPAQLHQLRVDARSVAQEIRQGYRSRAGRIWNAYRFDTAYGEMLKDEFAVEGIESVDALFAAVEALKARTMLDQLRTPPVELASPGQRSQAAALEKKALGFAPDDKESENLTLEEMKLVSQLSGFSELASSQKDRVQALDELERLYKVGAAGFRGVATPAPLQEVQNAIAEDEAIIEYVIPYHALHPARDLGILLITKRNIVQVHVDLSLDGGRIVVDGRAPVDASQLGDTVIGLRTALRSSNEKVAIKQLAVLHELLIQPLVNRGFQPDKYARLIIVAHGVLQYIPFAALMDSQGVPLIRKTAITMAPSASVWLELQKRGGAVDRWVAFGNPKLEAKDLPSLVNSAMEVEQISDILGKLQLSVKLGDQASKEQLLALAPGASILHLATHGEFPNENALDLHGLLLAGEKGKDGALRAMDVRRLNLTSTRLVVLSVCNGGLYRMGPTDEPYGLVPAFLLAGSQNVMATLWPIDDQFGRRFTVEFYKNLLQYGPAEAHRRACLRFIDEDELIRRWAGFVIVGAGRPFPGVPGRR